MALRSCCRDHAHHVPLAKPSCVKSQAGPRLPNFTLGEQLQMEEKQRNCAHTDLLHIVQGTTFTTMLTGMLEAVRWPPDPWALIAPNQGAGTNSTSPRVQAKRAHISTATLCAHPSRPIYISGVFDTLGMSCGCVATSNNRFPGILVDGSRFLLHMIPAAWQTVAVPM